MSPAILGHVHIFPIIISLRFLLEVVLNCDNISRKDSEGSQRGPSRVRRRVAECWSTMQIDNIQIILIYIH